MEYVYIAACTVVLEFQTIYYISCIHDNCNVFGERRATWFHFIFIFIISQLSILVQFMIFNSVALYNSVRFNEELRKNQVLKPTQLAEIFT